MDIQDWFDNKGSYADGLKLYARLPGCNRIQLRNLEKENTTNFIKLKYELKKALFSSANVTIEKEKVIAPNAPKINEKQADIKHDAIIDQSAADTFKKETMAMYPMELHSVYAERISNYYKACALKFQLNEVPEDDTESALKIILQLDDLWTRIDRAWKILDHWKDHKRIMPVKESEDFTKLTPIQLVMKRNQLESRISKREKTVASMEQKAEASPEDRTISNLLNRKREQLQQLLIDLETIRNILKNE